jgi:hypothetical protein
LAKDNLEVWYGWPEIERKMSEGRRFEVIPGVMETNPKYWEAAAAVTQEAIRIIIIHLLGLAPEGWLASPGGNQALRGGSDPGSGWSPRSFYSMSGHAEGSRTHPTMKNKEYHRKAVV